MSHPWYHTTRWRKASKNFLSKDYNTLCSICRKMGVDTVAIIVDHKIPHKGNYSLFWDTLNWQGLCAPCHSRHKQIKEKGGLMLGCDVNGDPLDEDHHWRK